VKLGNQLGWKYSLEEKIEICKILNVIITLWRKFKDFLTGMVTSSNCKVQEKSRENLYSQEILVDH
jgi:hypothetical protein